MTASTAPISMATRTLLGDPLVLRDQLRAVVASRWSGSVAASRLRCSTSTAALAPITATYDAGHASTAVAPSERLFMAI